MQLHYLPAQRSQLAEILSPALRLRDGLLEIGDLRRRGSNLLGLPLLIAIRVRRLDLLRA